MKNKIVGICVMTLLIATAVLPVAGTMSEIGKWESKPATKELLNSGWEKTFGGSGKDAGDSVQQTSDGGYIIIGETTSYGAGDRDVWLIKTDADGDIVWDETFGGNNYDRGKSGKQTSDGGYIIIGYTASYGAGGMDAWLIKTDENGDKSWDKTFGGIGDEEGVCVQQTTDGGYIVGVTTTSFGEGEEDIWLIKTDANGNTNWDKTYGGEYMDGFEWVQQTSDGGYIFTGMVDGFAPNHIYPDALLVKTDSDGDIAWSKTFGGGKMDLGHSVQQTNDGGYIIAGWTDAGLFAGGDVWLIKANADGDIVWDKTFGGVFIDAALWVQQTTDSGFIMTGCTGIINGGLADWAIPGVPIVDKLLVIKTDESGNLEWEKTCGPEICMGRSIQQTVDGGFIIVGNTGSHYNTKDLLLIKMDGNGNYI